jgi:hypothetical protein
MPHSAIIKGKECTINENETHVKYLGEWYEIHEDQEGDFYILGKGKAIYITILKHS